MITEKQKERLKANWGERAEALACNAEVRLYDASGPWECYIYAMNPEEEDEIYAIIEGESVEAGIVRLSEITEAYNAEGESLRVDRCFRPRHAEVILKRLMDKHVRY